MVKTSCKTLKKYASEERRTSKDYARRGFKSQSRDEARHSKFFGNKAKRC